MAVKVALTERENLVASRMLTSWWEQLQLVVALVGGCILLARLAEAPPRALWWMAGFGALVFAGIRFVGLPRVARKAFRSNRHLSTGAITYEWDADALHVQSAIGESRMPWGDLYGWKANAELLLLRISACSMWLLPRRCFPDQQSWDELREVVAARVPQPGAANP
jgi:hypothetical protein